MSDLNLHTKKIKSRHKKIVFSNWWDSPKRKEKKNSISRSKTKLDERRLPDISPMRKVQAESPVLISQMDAVGRQKIKSNHRRNLTTQISAEKHKFKGNKELKDGSLSPDRDKDYNSAQLTIETLPDEPRIHKKLVDSRNRFNCSLR